MEAHFVQHNHLLRYQLSKLQAYKSSFQAWKCVSFGYALLAMVLLLAKWHEVTTDLKLLTGIDQLIWASSSNGANGLPANGSQANASLDSQPNSTFRPRSWPPVPLDMLLLSAASRMEPEQTGSGPSNSNGSLASALIAAGDDNEKEEASDGQPASMMTSNSSTLISHHMQMMLGRELSGGQLLRQEVEAFLVEFRSAKSTLSLSSLLVAVYIISWILMTLAVNDARISNDVSLRNILVLSVFGAIDMAASCGFVMVRMIMFNVKNNNFVTQILGSSGLSESSVPLSADQLTAFTALRLIAMRSCSAYVDVYVSILVVLLTFLRLYAIIRGIAYYRFLRHFNDFNRTRDHQQQLAAAFHLSGSGAAASRHELDSKHHQQRHFVAYDDLGDTLRHDLMSPARSIWHHQQQLAGQQANMSSNPQSTSVFVQHVPHVASARATPVQQFSMEPQVILTSPTGQTTTYVPGTQQAASQTLRSLNMRPTVDYSQHQNQNQQQQQQQQQQQDNGTSKHPLSPLSTIVIEQPQASQQQQQQHDEPRVTQAHKSTNQLYRSPQLLLTTAATANTLAHQQTELHPAAIADELHANSRRRKQQQQSSNAIDESSAPNILLVNGKPHRLVSTGAREKKPRQRIADNANLSDFLATGSASFECEPVAKRRNAQIDSNNNNNFKSERQQPASFTLLSESQLNRLSRKLMAKTNATSGEPNGRQVGSAATLATPSRHLLSKYKVLARYRPVKQSSSLIRSLSKRGRNLLGSDRTAELATRPRAPRTSKDPLVGGPNHEFSFSSGSSSSDSSSGTGSDDTSNSSLSGAENRPEVEGLLEVETDAGLTFADLLGGVRGLRGKSLQATTTKSKRLSATASGTTRGLPAGLRQTEEYNLSPATTRGNRELLLRKYYYA